MFGPSEPGLHDRIEADFEAKLLSDPAAPENFPVQSKPRGILWLLGTWVLILAGAAVVAIVFEYTMVYIAIVIALALVAAAQTVLAIRRRGR